ncbi:MAG: RecX family transcriptional regulator [Oscillospiraceae bacterium]|nr:RecX family transcriptional regulator [Oscillospiraceae bacterium]
MQGQHERQTPEGVCRISRITPTKKGRFALFCEEEFLFSVDDETLVKYHLKEGSSLSGEELASVRTASETRKAKNKAFEYLSLRDYACAELYQKLCLKFDPHSAAAAVAEMQRLELLDDEAFARHRAAYLAGKGKSRREIQLALQRLGIARETAEDALEAAPLDERQAIRALIERQYRQKLLAGKRENVLAALARRGFSISDCRAALCEAEEHLKEENETDETCNDKPGLP